MFNKYLITWKRNPIPFKVLRHDVSPVIGGIAITLAPVILLKQFYGIKIFIQEDLEYYWKPFGSIFNANSKEAYDKKWYQTKDPITNYSRELLAGTLEVIQIHEDSTSTRYLLLNNIIAK
jgi:hypothetical protein